MKRNVTPTVYLALNISQSARAFGLRSEHIRQELLQGRLVARMVGARKLIAISDLQEWFKTFPRAVTKPKTRG